MANVCEFDMRITGKEDAVKEMISMLSWHGEFGLDGLGKVYYFATDELEETDVHGIYSVSLGGDCAWSIKSSMRDDGIRERSLESESKRLGLVVEVFSSETGMEFQEHLLIVKGDVVIDDCVKYEEHYIGNYDSLEAYNKANDTDFTPDMVNDNEEVCIGGFGADYADFKDVSHYFSVERATSLSEQIRLAEDKTVLFNKSNDLLREDVRNDI